MEKINIAELLKDCPQGMELDCAIWDNCTFEGIEDVGYINILVKTPNGQIKLSKEGCFAHNCDSAKCIIFPKGKTTWEGFVPPVKFKDGDILATNNGKFIAIVKKNGGKFYCCCHINSNYFETDYSGWFDRLATEEEKYKLFQAIKDNGYKWNTKTNTLEKLIKPKFKVGDRIKHKNDEIIRTIKDIKNNFYFISYFNIITNKYQNVRISIKEQDNYELVTNKFDINTLVPFESKILVRDNKDDIWQPAIYGCINKLNTYVYTMNNSLFYYYIPYEGNEHLLGTTNDCDDFYKTREE